VIFVPSVSYGFFSFLKAKNKSMPGQLKVWPLAARKASTSPNNIPSSYTNS
jgi:hypothetical protein